jgi:hypothetical protein
MTEVTVAIPLFGTHDGRNAIVAVVGAWLDQDVTVEVVLATDAGTQIDSTMVAEAGEQLRVVKMAKHETATIGGLRNLAATHGSGQWLYLTDSDVAPLGTDYLRRALAAIRTGAGFLAQPRMFRLTGPSPPGLPSRWAPPADDDIVCFVRSNPDGTVVRHVGESIVLWDECEYTPWVDPPPDIIRLSPDEFYRRPALHWGAVLVDRTRFFDVGGYCTGYQGWGGEDEDLLTKLKARSSMLWAWRELPSLQCVHFEHQRARRTPTANANEAFLDARRRAGAESMIAHDRAALHRLQHWHSFGSDGSAPSEAV